MARDKVDVVGDRKCLCAREKLEEEDDGKTNNSFSCAADAESPTWWGSLMSSHSWLPPHSLLLPKP